MKWWIFLLGYLTNGTVVSVYESLTDGELTFQDGIQLTLSIIMVIYAIYVIYKAGIEVID